MTGNYMYDKYKFDPKESDKKKNAIESLKVFLQKKYVGLALIAALGTGAYVAHQITKDKESEKTEQVKYLNWYPFEQHHIAFRDDNKDFFAKDFKLEKKTLAPGVVVEHDVGFTFYIVQAEDIKTETYYEDKVIWVKEKVAPSKWHKHAKPTYKKVKKIIKIAKTRNFWDFEKIRWKLTKLPQYNYLKGNEYDRSVSGNKTKSFNIPKESLKYWLKIPIPLDHKVREISPQDFANYCHQALQEMKQSHSPYSKDINNLLANVPEKDVIASMLAFARSETAQEYTNFVQQLGDVELHRREPAFKAFSFTYFHILMEKNSDRVTSGPGLAAREKLWLTEWQCYHPKNAAKLFLAYRVEKTHHRLGDVFPLTSSNIRKVGTKYNGSSTYVEKLQPNFTYADNLMHGKIIYYDDQNLKKNWFTYKGLDAKYKHMYMFKTPKWIHNTQKLKKMIIEEFNKNKAANCPTIHEDDILTQWGKKLSGDIIPDSVSIRIPSTS